MPSTPESRRRVLALALCVLSIGSPALAQTTRPQPPPPEILPADARRDWEQNPDWSRYVSSVVGDTAVKDELKALIDSGLNVNAKDRHGRTALHMAATFGQSELFRYLARKGSLDLNATDAEGRTPLMIAASLGGFDFKGMTSPWERFWTEPLCRPEVAGIPTNTEGLTQWFALWQAERTLVLYLLGAGADVNAVDKKGRTALDYAALGGLTDFEQLIRQTGRLRDQPLCVMKLVESPVLRGFRLGMSLREVTAHFRKFIMPETNSCGRLNLEFAEGRGTLKGLALKPEELVGISQVRLTFVDERLAYLRVTYTRDSSPSNPSEFRSALSNLLSLPGKWRVTGGGDNWDQAYVVGCDGFKVMTGYLAGPYIEVHDVEALRTLLQRKVDEEGKERRESEQEQERRKREFKP